MKKIFLMFSFILLTTTNNLGQVAVDITFLVTDSSYTQPISVGLDLTATNCIDPQLGEWDIPVFPPAGVFEMRFDLAPYGCPGISSYKDYRAPGNPPVFPFTGMIEHTLWFQTSAPGGLPIYLTYYLPAGTLMRITDWINGSFLNIGPFFGQGTAIIPQTYTSVFSKALLKMEYDNIVPVELTSFTASVLLNENAIQLNWSTTTETNNSGFEVERARLRSSNYAVASWEKIGFVPGFGSTTEPKSYSFSDEDVTTGTHKYRLKQIDFDGSFEYSNEIEIEVDFTPKEFVLYQNYPNPFNPSTTIKYSLPVESQVSINIYNALGEMIEELVSKTQSYGNYEVTWNAQNYSSGIYYYSFEVNSADGSQSHREMKKIVFLK